MAAATDSSYEGGSHWRRWNPHIHAPGTLLNDQFGNDWEGYLKAIEEITPVVEVLGITDYLCIETYKAVKAYKDAGRLKDVSLLFPNVEFRLTVETDRRKGINLHLLFCPNDPDHITRIESAMHRLAFEFRGNPHHCRLPDFVLLGRAHEPTLTDDDSARRVGANQFKVTLDELRKLFRNDQWVTDNCIVAVAASNNDGTAGLQNDASFAALRQEIERFAHVMFTSNEKSREFWLGKSAGMDLPALVAKYGGSKPCLHGCDAHMVSKTCKPDENRYCWIKGDPTFDSLRQALLEPEERVFIGEHAPTRHDASQCISQIVPRESPWISNGSIPFNSGLVAIIGARGSGKTALADIVAIGSSDTSPLKIASSFIYRATHPTNYLDKSLINTHWGSGEIAARWINKPTTDADYEAVRYLSQQFVEQLCSAEGLAVELRNEIERVVFDSTEHSSRFGTYDFDELSEMLLRPIRRAREAAQETIKNTSDQIIKEEHLESRVEVIKREQKDRAERIGKAKHDMKGLVASDKEQHAVALAKFEAAVTDVAGKVDALTRSKLSVSELKQEIDRFQTITAPQHLAKLKSNFADAGLTGEQWKAFELVFKGDVAGTITSRIESIDKTIALLSDGSGTEVDLNLVPLEKWPLTTLKVERDKAKALVGMDARKQAQYARHLAFIKAEEASEKKAAEELVNASGAAERRKQLRDKRRMLYTEVFQSFLNEQQVLQDLYGPLQSSLNGSVGSLKRLRLSVSREIDFPAWISEGEQLFDLRKESAFRGHGALAGQVERLLVPAWRSKSAEEVGQAMHDFIQEFQTDFMKAMPATVSAATKSVWVQRVATWLYNTDHINMKYSINYDGVAIEQLSPGTRGIVLLLLYLVIDKQDRRPLIIDQPEENLDPKSVFEELVPHFREARKRRQVIIVTHNANLVVNTDADQVIVASADPSSSGGLPTMSYLCGSIENPVIRTAVCEILEGGEEAFRDRERRYRLHRRSELLAEAT